MILENGSSEQHWPTGCKVLKLRLGLDVLFCSELDVQVCSECDCGGWWKHQLQAEC